MAVLERNPGHPAAQRMGLALDPLLEQSDAVLSQLIERYQKNR